MMALGSRRSTSSWALGRRCEGPTWMGWARRVRGKRSVGDGWGNIVGTVQMGLLARREGGEGSGHSRSEEAGGLRLDA